MANFIELTRALNKEEKILVNTDQIVFVSLNVNKPIILFSNNNELVVYESYEHIKGLLTGLSR